MRSGSGTVFFNQMGREWCQESQELEFTTSLRNVAMQVEATAACSNLHLPLYPQICDEARKAPGVENVLETD